jgi:hypothetical protein
MPDYTRKIFSWNRFKFTSMGLLGAALHYIDRICTVLYLLGAATVGGMLAWMAFTKTFWLLLLAVPVLITTALFSLGYWRNQALGLHLEWPFPPVTRKLKRINKSDVKPKC